MTIKDAYPLPGNDEIFTSQHNSYCLLALDLLIGYHEIPGRAEVRTKTAVITHKRLVVFNVMPVGLCNSPAPFQRLIEGIFHEQIGKDLAGYLDGLLLYALRHAEMLPILDLTLGPLIDGGF